jgi:hypothetical protein
MDFCPGAGLSFPVNVDIGYMGNSGIATYYSKQINFGYLKLISELSKLILGSNNSGLDSSGLRNGYRVFCPDLDKSFSELIT